MRHLIAPCPGAAVGAGRWTPPLSCRRLLRDLTRHPYAPVFWLTLAVTAIARGAAFLPAYAIDDYGLSLEEAPQPTSVMTMLAQGRFGQALLVQLLHRLQLEPRYARVFFVGLALVVLALLAVLVLRHWQVRPAGWLPVAAAGMIAVHPFGTEIFTFRTALGTYSCAMGLLALALAMLSRRWSWPRILGAAAIFALALSIYQSVLHYAVMIWLLGMAAGLTRCLVASRAIPPPRRRWPSGWRRLVRTRNSAWLVSFTLGTVAYLSIQEVVERALQLTMGPRAMLMAPAQIGERARAVLQILKGRFVEPDAFLNQWSKNLLWLLLASALFGLLAQVLRRPCWRTLKLALTVVAVLAAAMVWTLGLLLVLAKLWPVARVMAHAGVFWAAILVVAYRCLGPRPRPAVALLSTLILLTFIGSGNRVLHDQIRLNARDAAKANRIIDRLEQLPGFTGNEQLVVAGSAWLYPVRFHTTELDLNGSALGASWAHLGLFKEISGYQFREPTKAAVAVAASHCLGVAPWPAAAAVAVENGVAVICLDRD